MHAYMRSFFFFTNPSAATTVARSGVADFLQRVPGMEKHLGVLVDQGYHKMEALATLGKSQLIKMVNSLSIIFMPNVVVNSIFTFWHFTLSVAGAATRGRQSPRSRHQRTEGKCKMYEFCPPVNGEVSSCPRCYSTFARCSMACLTQHKYPTDCITTEEARSGIDPAHSREQTVVSLNRVISVRCGWQVVFKHVPIISHA